MEQGNLGPLRRSSSGEKEEPKRGLTPPGDQHDAIYTGTLTDAHYEGKPTEEELATLRRVAGGVPLVAYLLCLVEFCERASYYGMSWGLCYSCLLVYYQTTVADLRSCL